ncbi:M1 family metallopeptidase [Bizionia sp. KMM 8389]
MKYFLLLALFFFVDFTNAQQADYVDFKQIDARVIPETQTKSISGELRVQFDVLKSVDSIFLDAKNMDFVEVLLNGHETVFKNDGQKLIVYSNFSLSEGNYITFKYHASPKKAMYFVGWADQAPNQIWTQGQGKYTSNWLPSVDDMNDKIEFDLTVTFDSAYQVVANGNLESKEISGDNTVWQFNMEQPMSSYLVAMAIGDYEKREELSESGVLLELYYYPTDSLKFEPTYRYSKRMFDFLETELSVAYPWQNYKQVPVHDFLYSGMENTSLTIFSDAFVVDSIGFNDRNYVNVNAHELAHQWFGDLVTETSGTHHWLQEGFATYYALLVERDIFGDNYYYWRLYEYAQELLEQDSRNVSTALLDPKSSSTTFYKKGAWVLHALREKIGDEAFRLAVKRYLETYKFQNVRSEDFINEVEKASGKNLNDFFDLWLKEKSFPYNVAMESLEKSMFMQEYLMVDCEAETSKCRYYLEAPLSDKAKTKIISQVPRLITNNLFNGSLKVRQAIALNVSEIPDSLKVNFESLLSDESYVTNEAALYNLWVNFPLKRAEYLDKTKTIVGFSDKNVRLLWLVLALSTADYNNSEKTDYFRELESYTFEVYNAEVRQSAFTYLNALNAFTEVSLVNLMNGTRHYNWRFKSFSKNLLEVLSNSEKYAELIRRLTL